MTDRPSEDEIQVWQRRLGSSANNRGWTLSEQATRSPAEDAEMLHAAHASRYLWSKVGNEKNFALGDLLLGHVHALLGQGQSAMRYANAAFDFFSSRVSEPWEMALVHAVLCNAAYAAGCVDLHRTHFATAVDITNTMAIPEERKIIEATLNVIPKP